MIILPPRRDSEKDTLANYTTGAAVEKKNNSIFQFFLCFTHTLPLMVSVQASLQNHH